MFFNFKQNFSKLSCLTILTILLIAQSNTSKASHIRGAELDYIYLNDSTIGITLTTYWDCYSPVGVANIQYLYITSVNCAYNNTITANLQMTEDWLPVCSTDTTNSCTTGPFASLGITKAIHYATVQVPNHNDPNCDWKVYWEHCCRNSNINNLNVQEGISVATSFFANGTTDTSPKFVANPTFVTCVNQPTQINFAAYDLDGDSLVYSLGDCYKNATTPVNYAVGYSGITPMTASTFSLNSETGIITIHPTIPQVAVICVLVEEYRNGVKIGEAVRDAQITVLNCSNAPPTISGINGTASPTGTTGDYSIDICVEQTTCFDVQIFDTDSTMLGIEIFGMDTTITWSIDSTQYPMIATICWTPKAENIGTYNIPIRVFDDACPIIMESYYIYQVNVQAIEAGIDSTIYAPVFFGTSVDITTTSADSTCQFVWSPSTGLSCDTCRNPTASPAITTTYYAQIDCGIHCTTIDSVIVQVFSLNTNEVFNIQNISLFPNPSKGQVILEYDLRTSGTVQIEVFDILGKQLQTIIHQKQLAGHYQQRLNPIKNRQAGVYFVKLTVDGQSVVKKWVVQP